MNFSCCVLCLFSLIVSVAHGPSAAEKVAMAAFEASQKRAWQSYAELVHPASLREFRGILAPAISSAQEKGPEEQAVLLAYFDGATDLKGVLAWEPKEFFSRFMTRAYPPVPRVKDVTATAEVLGTILEGPDQAHVVVRIDQRREHLETSKVAVVTLLRSGGPWKVMPSEWADLAEFIQRSLSATGNIPIEGRAPP